MHAVHGHVRAAGEADWSGHRVELSYGETVSVDRGPGLPPEKLTVPRTTGAVLAPDGVFELRVAVLANVVPPVRISVSGPDGASLADRDLTVKELEDEILLDAVPLPPRAIRPSGVPALGRRIRLSGRVFDDLGRTVPAGLPILISGVPKGKDALVPLIVTETQPSGYFGADWTADELERAQATIAGGTELPVRLDTGRLPAKLILVTRLADTALDEGSCECEVAPPLGAAADDVANNPLAYSQDLGGTCQGLTTPNRVVEEFSYHLVVRTTEPQIRGTTLGERRAVPERVLSDLAKVTGAARVDLALPPGDRTATNGDSAPNGDRASHGDDGDAGTGGESAHDGESGSQTGGNGGGSGAAGTGRGGGAGIAAAIAPMVDAATVRDLLRRPAALTVDAVELAVLNKELRHVVDVVDVARRAAPARVPLDATTPVDWDDTPTLYQATSVAHGHVLGFRQVWRADGYSLGDLLHSVPLAPGQQRRMAVLDWERREESRRDETLEFEEQLEAVLDRDRDITEIAGSRLAEESAGGSRASQWGVAGGIGGGFIGNGWGIFGGVAGGAGGADADAWQNSSRTLSANSLQALRDRTTQRASAVRDQRSTVIQTVAQGESVRAETEFVANFNHCHAITIQHFEVLRHFLVDHELADVRECLFVPLPITLFDLDKARRWRESLQRHLRDRTLRDAFDAVERVLDDWQGHNLPPRRFSEEAPEDLLGELRVSFVIPRPRDAEDGGFQLENWRLLRPLLNVDALELWTARLNARAQAERDRVFRAEVAPGLAERLAQHLRFAYVTRSGGEVPIPLDATLVSRYAEGVPLYVSLRPAGPLPPIPREEITRFMISYPDGDLPPDAQVIVHSGRVRYHTEHLRHLLFDQPRLLNDLGGADRVVVPTPLSRMELRDPRAEDRRLAERLIAHLNEQIEWYHQAIWSGMSAARRYLLLDGVIAPNAGGRSVAGVVENRLIGISGNCLILPVAPGIHLDPTLVRDDERVSLQNAYAAAAPPPLRVSVPTRGVFAEAVAGSCNSCEVPDDTRFWRWDESPLPETLTAIEPLSTASRAEPQAALTPTPLPQPLVAIQNAPELPDPLGLQEALKVLAQGNLFKDITGLTETQKNALAAFKGALDTAQFFGKQAADLAKQHNLGRSVDRTLAQIQQARTDGLLSPDQAQNLAVSALRALVGRPQQGDAPPADDPAVKKVIDAAAQADQAQVAVRTPAETVEATFQGVVGAPGALLPRSDSRVEFVAVPIQPDDRRAGPPITFTSGPPERNILAVKAMAQSLGTGRVGRFGKALFDAGLLIPDPAAPASFLAQMRLRITWPTDSTGAVAGTARLPVVVLLHGHSESWTVVWKTTPTGTTGGVDVFDGDHVTQAASHEGFAYLQDVLARLGIVSVSVDCNYANTFDSWVETRADLAIEALHALRRLDGDPAHRFHQRLDFDRVGLFGHSRGGDAVVRAVKKNRATAGTPYKIVAACSLAPTDITGTARPPTGGEIGRQDLTAADLGFYLVLYGAQDGDAHTLNGVSDRIGTGFRHYDRARCQKAMVFLDGCNHNRFNTTWPVNDPFRVAGEIVRPNTDHRALAGEYVGGLFAWQLAGRTQFRPLFNGTQANGRGVPASIQWAFGTQVSLLDDFEAATPAGATRTVGAAAEVKAFGDISIGGSLGPRVGHQTRVLHGDVTGGASRCLELGFAAARDLSGFTDLMLSLTGHFDLATKATIAAGPLPNLKVSLVDEAGKSASVTRTAFRPRSVPGRPAFHEVDEGAGKVSVTVLRLETASVALGSFTGVDLKRVRKVIVESVAGTAPHVFVDDLRVSRM
ncbi:hypothetical protein [Nonomuraea sp. NPDC050643]|uniref:hypothetical protein n=1 Tax=Nonomuraea sp. NPDC050643 TaxID=3155660 RepID=UPI0033F7CF55